MTFFRAAALILLVWVLAIAAQRFRRRLITDGASGAIATAVIALSTYLVVAMALGTAGLFSEVWVACGLLAAAIGLAWLGRAWTTPEADEIDPHADGHFARVGVGVSAMAGGAWIYKAIAAYEAGPGGFDSLRYHLTNAAAFVHSGSTLDLPLAVPYIPTHFHPANTELLDAGHMLLLRSDVLVAVSNIGWLALALLACRSIGEHLGRAWLPMITALPLLGSPMMIETQAGTALNDLAVVALLLSSVAMLLRVERSPGYAVVGSLAAAIALGVKLSSAGVVAGLTLGLLALLWRKRAFTTIAACAGAGLLPAGYWMLRNLIHSGSPIPTLEMAIGPLRLPWIPYGFFDPSWAGGRVIDRLDEPRTLANLFASTMNQGFGPLWVGVLFLAVTGTVIAWRRGSMARASAVAAVVGVVTYVLTPTTGPLPTRFSPEINQAYGDLLFRANIRYLTPALVVVLVFAAAGTSHRVRQASVVVAMATTLFALWDARVFLPSVSAAASIMRSFAPALVLVAIAGALAIGARRRDARHLAGGAAALAFLFAVAGLGFAAREQRDGWYASGTDYEQMLGAWTWIKDQGVTSVRHIDTSLPYPLAGPEFRNDVGPVTSDPLEPDGGRPATCDEFLAVLIADTPRFVVVGPGRFDVPPRAYARWLGENPGFSEVFSEGAATVFERTSSALQAHCAPVSSSTGG